MKQINTTFCVVYRCIVLYCYDYLLHLSLQRVEQGSDGSSTVPCSSDNFCLPHAWLCLLNVHAKLGFLKI